MRYLLNLLILMASLSACGIKGPLYLPEQRYPQKNVSSAPKGDATKPASATEQPINTTTETK